MIVVLIDSLTAAAMAKLVAGSLPFIRENQVIELIGEVAGN